MNRHSSRFLSCVFCWVLVFTLTSAAARAEGSAAPNASPAPTLRLHYSLEGVLAKLLVETEQDHQLYSLGSSREIALLTERAVGLLPIGTHLGVETQADIVMTRLGDLLLGPVAERLTEELNLEIFLDPALRQLPFAALPLPVGADQTAAARRAVRLLERATLTIHTPSTGTGTAVARPAPDKFLAVISDPVYGVTDPRNGDGFSGHTQENSDLAPPSVTTVAPATISRSSFRPDEDYPRIAFSELEANSILDLASAAQTLTISGFDANLDQISATTLSEYRVLHFATHSRLAPFSGSPTSLLLSTQSMEGETIDGSLTAKSIRDWHLTPDLVVLSACKTAFMDPGGGLTAAFLDAGAQQVIGSLWDIDDRSTALLMTEFYRALIVDQQSAPAALRQAQLSLAHNPRWKAPYYWAGFVVQEDLNRDSESPF